MSLAPHLDAPLCACGGPIIPYRGSATRPDATIDVQHIRCASCGADWIENDPAIVARVWWSAGAWLGRKDPTSAPDAE